MPSVAVTAGKIEALRAGTIGKVSEYPKDSAIILLPHLPVNPELLYLSPLVILKIKRHTLSTVRER